MFFMVSNFFKFDEGVALLLSFKILTGKNLAFVDKAFIMNGIIKVKLDGSPVFV